MLLVIYLVWNHLEDLHLTSSFDGKRISSRTRTRWNGDGSTVLNHDPAHRHGEPRISAIDLTSMKSSGSEALYPLQFVDDQPKAEPCPFLALDLTSTHK